MNIGIVTTWFERGAAYVSRAYMDTLSARHKVFIYARAGERFGKGDSKWNQPYVTWGKEVPGKMATYVDWQDFKHWALTNRLDAIIFNEQHSWEVIIKCLAGLKIPIGTYVDYYKFDTVPFFWLYDFLLCNTRRHYSVFKDHPRAYYLPWGNDISVYKPRERLGPSDRLVFFHSCGLSPRRKGTDILVNAFQQVKGKAKLIIHSQGPFTELPPTLLKIRQDPRIELIEAEIGTPGLYHLGDVYVYPSRLEGIGLTIAEALASGLPVITTDSPPMNEFVVPELNGKLVKVEKYQSRQDNYYWPESFASEPDLTQSMQFYVDNLASINIYRTQARGYAEVNLDWAVNSKPILDFIQNLPRGRHLAQRNLIKTAAQYERSSQKRGFAYIPAPLVNFLKKFGYAKVLRFLRRLKP